MKEIKRIEKKRALIKAASFLFILFSLTVSSCKNDTAEKQIRSLDSLSGALNQKLSELKSSDTATLQKAISRYNDYRKFIQQNISDTISKDEADRLQQFYKSGKNLMNFQENRQAIIARGNLISSQLNKLMTDARNNSTNENFASDFARERSSAELIIKQSLDQQQVFLENLQEFKLSIGGVEALIKARNNGQMPVIIRDSISF